MDLRPRVLVCFFFTYTQGSTLLLIWALKLHIHYDQYEALALGKQQLCGVNVRKLHNKFVKVSVVLSYVDVRAYLLGLKDGSSIHLHKELLQKRRLDCLLSRRQKVVQNYAHCFIYVPSIREGLKKMCFTINSAFLWEKNIERGFFDKYDIRDQFEQSECLKIQLHVDF